MNLDIPDLSNNDRRHYVLKYVLNNVLLNNDEDVWLEFGVATGNTINLISSYTKNIVYGFDSFEGLPEKWRDGFDKGAFDRKGILPEVNQNVKLIKGWFNESLPPFLSTLTKKISFVHIDCDLYSSTKLVLDLIKPHMNKTCVFVFDELLNYDGFETGELLALNEFIKETQYTYKWIGMNGKIGMKGSCHENVALIIYS